MSQALAHIELHIPVLTDQQSLVALLADASGLSKQVIKQTMQNGAVWLSHGRNTRRVRRAKQKLARGDEVHLYYDREIQSIRPERAHIIADEGAYSVWFKPSGMYSQGSKWGDHCTIYRWAETELKREAFIVHRLDRAASGLILLAHTKTMTSQLSRLFEQRQIKKVYRALVKGDFSASTTVTSDSPSLVQPVLLDNDIDGRHARSHVTLLNYDWALDRSLLQVVIDTGRKHQIRRHLSAAGHPIIGDRLYGGHDVDIDDGVNLDNDTYSNRQQNLQLAACYLGFDAPLQAIPEERLKAISAEPLKAIQKDYWAPDSLLPISLIDHHRE